jgi:hypothetical protein
MSFVSPAVKGLRPINESAAKTANWLFISAPVMALACSLFLHAASKQSVTANALHA